MPRNPRRYDLERKYDSQPEVMKKRAERKRARRAYEAVHGDLPSNVDVDHKRPLAKGGKTTAGLAKDRTPDLSNLRAVPAAKNRSFARTKKAHMK